MYTKVLKFIRKNYNAIVGSIAFYPAVISIGFLLLSILMLELDFSSLGKNIKSQLSWLSLRDASTARTIISTIAGGIISLTVFSFSMVMILLNQAASQMSNRMLDSMIGNRYQQTILGFYFGSIVYSLFLLSTIRDISSGIYVPALSIYLLLVVTIVDIYLFIYFLHYVTQSVKYDTIIKRIYKQTLASLQATCFIEQPRKFNPPMHRQKQVVYMPASDYFQGFDKKVLLNYAVKHEVTIEILHPTGSYILQGIPFLNLYTDKGLSLDDINEMLLTVDFYNGQPIDKNPYYGYHQLAEVAIKALSPGINDPETAVLSIHALTDLFRFRLHYFLPLVIEDSNGEARIAITDWTFENLFKECFQPIWDYGKNDMYILDALHNMFKQLMLADTESTMAPLFKIFFNKVEAQIASRR